jgi:hypothetical protein
MKATTHFAFRVDIWDDAGGSIVEHVAGVDDFEVARRPAGRQWRAGQGTRMRIAAADDNVPAALLPCDVSAG